LGDELSLRAASERFLGMMTKQIKGIIFRTLEGRLRAILGEALAHRDATIESAQADQEGQTRHFEADVTIAQSLRDEEMRQAEFDAGIPTREPEAQQDGPRPRRRRKRRAEGILRPGPERPGPGRAGRGKQGGPARRPAPRVFSPILRGEGQALRACFPSPYPASTAFLFSSTSVFFLTISGSAARQVSNCSMPV
jgi:hypothetical protein